LLDFDRSTVGIASQPFWLFWHTAEGKVRSHVPDYFVRLISGDAVVVDCRPSDRIKPKDQAAFDATRAACDLLGWRYELVGAPPETMLRNVRWLAGYRHPRHALPEVSDALRAVFATPTPLTNGAEMVGDPIAVLPGLFYLLWRQELHVDLSLALQPDSVISGVHVSATGVETT
jgi:hypothetical protein